MKWPVIFLLIAGTSLAALAQAEVSIRKDIVYKKVNGRELKLDVGQPAGPGPFPAIVFFHGGGWQQGNKSHMHKWIRRAASSGYVGVSVQYSFAPEFKWPSQVLDARDAIRWLRDHAGIYNVDPDRIGVMGESAGGYLALMVGLTSIGDNFEGKTALKNSSGKVQAVVSYFSATDFTARRQELSPELQQEMLNYYGKPLEQVRAEFVGSADPNDPILKKISVLPYVDKNDPPVLIFHGDKDPFVSLDHALKLRNVLKKARVPNELVIVEGAGHGWSGEDQETTTRKMMEFFDDKLKTTNK